LAIFRDAPLERDSLIFSGIGHLMLVVLLAFGLPDIIKRTAQYDVVVPFDVVNISEVANLKRPQIAPKEPPPRRPQKFAAPAPKPPEAAVQPVSELTVATPEEVIKPEMTAPIKEVQQQEEVLEAPKQQLEEAEPVDFSTVLKTVEKLDEEQQKPVPDSSYDPTRPLSMTVLQAIKKQMAQCWTIPAGARNAEELVITVNMLLNPDGTVQTAQVEDASRMGSDPFFRAAAESAVRAVYHPKCNPLPVPLDQYEKWRTIRLNFNPRQMLGM